MTPVKVRLVFLILVLVLAGCGGDSAAVENIGGEDEPEVVAGVPEEPEDGDQSGADAGSQTATDAEDSTEGVALAPVAPVEGEVDVPPVGPLLDDGAAAPSEENRERAQAVLPGTPVINVDSGEELTLDQELANAGGPVLLWFWSPDCPACNAEVEVVERFARRFNGSIAVVAVGAEGSQAKAEAFLERSGATTPLVVWDDGATRNHYGVDAVPSVVMIDPSGAVMARWSSLSSEVFTFAERRTAEPPPTGD